MRTRTGPGMAIALLVAALGLAACVLPEHLNNPPANLQESDLSGTWVARYGQTGETDTLVLRPEGVYKQRYENEAEAYLFETPWSTWSLERFADGRVRVHLRGGRYYLSGIYWAEKEGRLVTDYPAGEPLGFHDPWDPNRWFSSVSMLGQLVLNVRSFASGEVVLAHMMESSDSGFGEVNLFRRTGPALPDDGRAR